MALPASGHWSASNFWERHVEAKKSGGVFYFWGHSCELGDNPELWAWLESILERISADPEAEWADVVDLLAAKAAQTEKAHSLTLQGAIK